MKKMKLVGSAVGGIFLLGIVLGFFYLNDYYHAEASVVEVLEMESKVRINEIEDGLFLDGPVEEQALIFYPGAKVEYTAYLPLLREVAEEVMDVFVIKMPGNMAFLGMNKADHIIKAYSYEEWFMGGHSLGGAMAASYTAAHCGDVCGLVLLAAYPVKSLDASDLKVVSVYGSEDSVLNTEKLIEGRALMPSDYVEVCIDGGNHAYFGNYGVQEGDGLAKISREEQQRQTVEAIKGNIAEARG